MEWILVLIVLLLAVLALLSIFESAINQLTRLGLRVLAEKNPSFRHRLLADIAADRRHFLIPLQFSSQLLAASLAVLVTWWFCQLDNPRSLVWALLSALGIVTFFRQVIPYFVTLRNPERILLHFVPLFNRTYRFLYWMSWPLTFVFSSLRATQDRMAELEDSEEDASDEEIQAYLGVGEEEGIFDETETRLIQSALEFGSTLVREIMTPRNEIVAIELNSTLSELRELIVNTKHSRIPVYREQIDQMVGIVYVRNLLSRLESGHENDPITPIVTEVPMVPESKKVADLLKEMQAEAEQMAIVVNEYGTVSGLVTVEDLLEEIVGEISDEDELRRSDLVYEGGGSYIVRGGYEVGDLEETLGVSFRDHDASTVSGLVVDHLGKVPAPGESLLLDGTRIDVLSADHRRIHKMRIRVSSEPEHRPLSEG